MRQILKIPAALLLGLSPLMFLWARPPLVGDAQASSARYPVTLALVFLLGLGLIGFRYAQRVGMQSRSLWLFAMSLLVGGVGLSGLSAGPFLCLAGLALTILTVGANCGTRAHVQAGSLLSLVLTFLIFGWTEIGLRALSPGTLVRQVELVPALAPIDRGNELLNAHGFRGRQACTDCPTDLVRIVTMGGSSTYGIPLPSANLTFSAGLQKLLDERRPDKHFEVLNAGIPGYGIVQVLDSLEKYVLQFRPHIVIINCWFNDSAKSVGWYGLAGLSDRQAEGRVRMLRFIENTSIYHFLSRLRIYGLFRYYVLEFSRIAATRPPQKHERRRPRRRMEPQEFRMELERVADLGHKYNFLPIFLYEVTNRQEPLQTVLQSNRYLRAVSDVAAEHNIPVVDTISPFAFRRDDWLFSDFIHPNRTGHQIIAQTIFDSVFNDLSNPQELQSKFGL